MEATPPAGTPHMAHQRPLGITILAILWFLGALLLVFGGIGLLTAGALILGPLAMALGGAFLALGLFGFLVGWGLWSLKPWAWTLAVLLGLINIALNAYYVALGNWSSIGSIAIYALVLFYLTRPGVKAAFGGPSPGTA